jgi:tRNA(fMet)-specific endonuclease VapC
VKKLIRIAGNNLLIDTNIAVYAMNKQIAVAEWLNSFDKIYIPSIAVGELYFGAFKSNNTHTNIAAITSFLNECEILKVDQNISECYGKIKFQLKQKGKPIPENDIWIAAFAIFYNLPIGTNDGHFNEVDEIQIATWL